MITASTAEGLYVGIKAGTTLHAGKRSDSTNITSGEHKGTYTPKGSITPIKPTGMKKYRPILALLFGYEKRFNKFSFSLEPYVSFSRQEHLVSSDVHNEGETFTNNRTLKRNAKVGINFMPGFIFKKDWMLYGIAGVFHTKYTFTYEDSDDSGIQKKGKFGLTLGGGLKKQFNNMGIGFEISADFVKAQNIRIKADKNGNEFAKLRIKPRNINLLFKLTHTI